MPVLYEKKLIGLFTHNFLLYNLNSQKIEGIFNEGLRKVLNNQHPLNRSATSHQFFFFIRSQNRFHLLIYTSRCARCCVCARCSVCGPTPVHGVMCAHGVVCVHGVVFVHGVVCMDFIGSSNQCNVQVIPTRDVGTCFCRENLGGG